MKSLAETAELPLSVAYSPAAMPPGPVGATDREGIAGGPADRLDGGEVAFQRDLFPTQRGAADLVNLAGGSCRDESERVVAAEAVQDVRAVLAVQDVVVGITDDRRAGGVAAEFSVLVPTVSKALGVSISRRATSE